MKQQRQIAIPFLSLSLMFLLLLWPTAALAQEPEYGEINEIAKLLSCPTCAGVNLADCRTVTCQQWRDQISELVQEGYSDQEVIDYFSTRYGDQVLQEPPRQGFNLLLWILPILALILGGGWLYYTLRSWSDTQPVSAISPTMPGNPSSDAANMGLSDQYLDQVDQDLGLK